MLNYLVFYRSNNDFKEYVDKYAAEHDIDFTEALTHKIVKIYAENLYKNLGGCNAE